MIQTWPSLETLEYSLETACKRGDLDYKDMNCACHMCSAAAPLCSRSWVWQTLPTSPWVTPFMVFHLRKYGKRKKTGNQFRIKPDAWWRWWWEQRPQEQLISLLLRNTIVNVLKISYRGSLGALGPWSYIHIQLLYTALKRFQSKLQRTFVFASDEV